MAIFRTASDRNFMRQFAIMIALLAGAAVIFTIIGTLVWASLPKESVSQNEMQRANDRISPVSAVFSGEAGRAAVNQAAATSAPAAAAASAVASGPYTYDAAQGKTLFDSTCAACHQATGEGVAGTFPPLKGNAVVNNADPAEQIETILHGRQGTVINGQKYSGIMPPFGSQLNDAQIADIANYERSSWGNHGKHVTSADVAAARTKGK